MIARRYTYQPGTVDGGLNPRINGDDHKTGTRFAIEPTVARLLVGRPLSMPTAAAWRWPKASIYRGLPTSNNRLPRSVAVCAIGTFIASTGIGTSPFMRAFTPPPTGTRQEPTGLVLPAPAGAFLQRLDRIPRNLPRDIEQGCAIGKQGVDAFEVDGALDFRDLHRRTRP